MAEVRVRKVDDGVIQELRARADREGTSLSALVRAVLTEAAERPRREWSQKLRDMRAAIREKHGVLPDSTPGIRAWRDGLE